MIKLTHSSSSENDVLRRMMHLASIRLAASTSLVMLRAHATLLDVAWSLDSVSRIKVNPSEIKAVRRTLIQLRSGAVRRGSGWRRSAEHDLGSQLSCQLSNRTCIVAIIFDAVGAPTGAILAMDLHQRAWSPQDHSELGWIADSLTSVLSQRPPSPPLIEDAPAISLRSSSRQFGGA